MRAGDPEADAACAAAIDAARGDAVLFGQAVLTSCGLGVAIVGVDRKRVALLEEALDGLRDDALRARLLSRLAIALYYDPGRSRSGPLSAEAIAAARAADDPDALLAALNSRHVALWHPSGLEERFGVADEMIALAIAASDPRRSCRAATGAASISGRPATGPGSRPRWPSTSGLPTRSGSRPSAGTGRCGARRSRPWRAATTRRCGWRRRAPRSRRAPAIRTASCSGTWWS